MIPIRKWLGRIRDRLEGVCFAVLCVLLRIGHRAPRLAVLRQSGLHALRLAWWPHFELERYRDIWRYVLLIEWFETENAKDPKASPPPSALNDIDRMLVVKLGHFGDTLQIVPLLRGLKKAKPELQLDMVVGPWCEELARRIPYVDTVHVHAPHLKHLHRGNAGRCPALREEVAWVRSLRARAYDVLLTTYNTGYIDLFLIAGIRPKAWLGPAPECRLYEDIGRQIDAPFRKGLYEAERVAALGRGLGVDVSDTRLDFWIAQEEEDRARALLQGRGVAFDEPRIIVCPGAGWPGKQWPAERFAEVADRLIEETGYRVLICGAPGERALAERVRGAMTKASINLAGETGWGVLAALIRGARLFLGNDSGPMHLAGVYETPSVLLFGPTSPGQWAPPGSAFTALRAVGGCPDCWPWHPDRDCAHDRACMKRIEVGQVLEKAHEQLIQPTTKGWGWRQD